MFENTHPDFQEKIRELADQHGKEVEQVYAWWQEYSNSCRDYDQSALLGEFAEWYKDRLGAVLDFEARRTARVDRLERRAEAARQEAQARFHSSANQELSLIPFGQPILVGHHSEHRHRRVIERAHNDMDKGCEALSKAKHYDYAADAASNNGAIMTDDPDALPKLRKKLAGLETLQAMMKAVNTAHTKYLKNPNSLDSSDLPEQYKEMIRTYTPHYSWEPHPYPPYAMQNNNANIHRVRERIASLGQLLTAQINNAGPTEALAGTGWKVIEDVQDNRILFIFDDKPPEATRKLLKSHGFRWSPNRVAWVRHLNNAGRCYAEHVAKQLAPAIAE